MYIYYIIVFLCGCTTALAELISRYDRSTQILKYKACYFYLLINGIASIFAYWFITEYKLDLGFLSKNEIGRIILASTSSMVILRSSVASLKIGNKNIEAGLASITQVFLHAADRSYDRERSNDDYKKIETIMQNIDFNKAKIDLPLTCLCMMKNVPIEEQKLLGDEVSMLEKDSRSNKAKSINLGVIISKTTGFELLNNIVNSFKETISINSDTDAESQKEKTINSLLSKFQ
jgi:hypothetical protein